MAIKTFSVGEVLTATDTNTYLANAGLVYVAETSFTNAANPFINGCFTSNYQNYMVKVVLSTSLVNTNILLRLRYDTNTVENGNVYDRFGFLFSGGGAIVSLVNGDQPNAVLGDSFTSSQRFTAQTEIYAPNEAIASVIQNRSWGSNSGDSYFNTWRIDTTRQYTGLELTASGGATMTGVMRVYGYRQA